MKLTETALVKLVVKTQDLYDALKQQVDSRDGFRIITPGDTRNASLMVVQLGDNYIKDFQQVESIINNAMCDEVFLVSENSDTVLLRQALTIGAREFLQIPLDQAEFENALDRFKQRQIRRLDNENQTTGNVISIAGSKGGVGTTTVAVNLAVAMAALNPEGSVALMDMNTMFGEIPVFLDLTPKFTWADITRNIHRLDPVFLQNVLSRHESGVQVLPSPNYLNKKHSPTLQIMETLLEQLKRMFDWVIIDAGQTMDDAALKALQMSDTLMLVSIQSLPCLTNTTRLLKSYEETGFIDPKRIHVVLNRYVKKSDISLDSLQKGIGKQVSWILPNDYASTMAAINHGKTLSQIAPKSAIAKSYNGLAGFFMPEPEQKKKTGWLFGRRKK